MSSSQAHPHDSAMPLSKATWSVLEQVDEVIAKAIEDQEPDYIIQAGLDLRMASQASGLGLAKLLYESRKNWHLFGSDDSFATVAKTQMGVADQTYNKYIWVWEHVINHPYLNENQELKKLIMGKPIGGLILLTAAARENQLEESDWEQLGKAPNISAIRDIIARVRGHIGPAKNTLRMLLHPDGTWLGKLGGDIYEVVGFVHRDGSKLSEAIISRLENSGVVIEAK